MFSKLFIFIFGLIIPGFQQIYLPKYLYQDNMVLQKSPQRAILWGYAAENSQISIELLGKTYSSKVLKSEINDLPKWSITLNPIDYVDPISIEIIELDVEGKKSSVILKNVVFGDVWICSGQSNMQWSLDQTFGWENEVKTGDQFKNIRLFSTKLIMSNKEETELLGVQQGWTSPNENVLKKFSSLCWHFGKSLSNRINNSTIGLIVSAWGGTEIEKWTSKEVLNSCGNAKKTDDSFIWNSMIHPFLKFPIHGAIWYQGESNAYYNLDKYSCAFEGMINSWRKNWYLATNGSTNPIFPFGFVQIANHNVETQSVGGYPWLRWHQTADFGFSPNNKLINVFMTTAVDLVENSGDPIHPRYKQEVGIRLSLGAANLAYNQNIEYAPPKVKIAKIISKVDLNNNGLFDLNEIVEIKFESEFLPIELNVKNKKGFDICCDETKCNALESTNTWIVIKDFELNGDQVTFQKPSNCLKPKFVRYLWRQKPCEYLDCAFYSNRTNLPVYPFLVQVIDNLEDEGIGK